MDMYMPMILATSAPTDNYGIIQALRIAIIVIMTLTAIFAILVVLIQPGNSSGIDAIGGSSETFFGKNKTKTFESKLKKFTVIALVILGVLSVVFFVIELLPV